MRILIVITLLLTAISYCAFSIAGKSHSTKGKEKWPADSVFKNIKVIVGESSVSAEHFLWMMNWGWSKELGVSCFHCHNAGNWASDSLPSKNIARGMWTAGKDQ